MTTERPITLQEHAMRFGTLMGLFWIIKFILFPRGFKIPLLQLLFILLTLFVPVLGYIYARKFRNECCQGSLSFFRAFAFTFFMYMFASILTAAVHYIYFRFIDNGFIFESYRTQLETLQSAAQGELSATVDQFMKAFETIASLTPLQLTLQLVSQNIFYGTLLALPTALIVMKQKKY